MKSPIRLALIAALLIEALNLRFVVVPIDVGLPEDATLWERILADQWVYLHYAGLLMITSMDRLSLQRYAYPILYVTGYLETALLLVFGILIFRLWRHLLRRHVKESAQSS